MATSETLTLEEVRVALAELDEISKDEYKCGLETLLLDTSPDAALRVQRVTGIVLKKPFAKRKSPPPYTRTGARWSWPWAKESPEEVGKRAEKEFEILNQLRMPGPWNERKPLAGNAEDHIPISWSELQDDADNERGLFKIMVLYVDDNIKGRHRRPLREYLEADESRHFEAGLDLATLVFDATVTAPRASLIGLPTVSIGIALVGIQWGYRKLTDTNADRLGDRSA